MQWVAHWNAVETKGIDWNAKKGERFRPLLREAGPFTRGDHLRVFQGREKVRELFES